MRSFIALLILATPAASDPVAGFHTLPASFTPLAVGFVLATSIALLQVRRKARVKAPNKP